MAIMKLKTTQMTTSRTTGAKRTTSTQRERKKKKRKKKEKKRKTKCKKIRRSLIGSQTHSQQTSRARTVWISLNVGDSTQQKKIQLH